MMNKEINIKLLDELERRTEKGVEKANTTTCFMNMWIWLWIAIEAAWLLNGKWKMEDGG